VAIITEKDAKPSEKPKAPIEGKRVFNARELNQSGEDKEYFHPDNDHKFKVPKDANDHALTPDIEVSPKDEVDTKDETRT
jgi:hypothetical protein